MMEKDPKKREEATLSLVNTYRRDTPKEKVRKLAVESNTFKINTRKFDFVKGKIKNKVICHPNKKETECNIPKPDEIKRRVHENKISFAFQSQQFYDDENRGGVPMAEHKHGGGKKRAGLECGTSTHIINQLRIVRDLRDPDGSPVLFNDGICCLVDQKYAIQALKLYERVIKPDQKEALIEKLAHSPKSFLNTIKSSDEHLLQQLEEFIKFQKRNKRITLAEKVSSDFSSRRLAKVVLEDFGSIWRSSLVYHDGNVICTNHKKEEGIFGLQKLRNHLYTNIAEYYQVPFEDKT